MTTTEPSFTPSERRAGDMFARLLWIAIAAVAAWGVIWAMP